MKRSIYKFIRLLSYSYKFYIISMPCVHIGKGAIIGANAVVTHNVPSYWIAGGEILQNNKRLNANGHGLKHDCHVLDLKF